jgi:1-acyl-sn-glycerol-3-phosphate acyltransferase
MTRLVAAIVALLARIASGPSVRFVGEPPGKRQCIFFANHGSHLDVVVLWAVLPGAMRAKTRPVAAKDYWEQTRLRTYFATKVFRAVLVDREGQSLRQLRNQLDQLVGVLDAGDSLLIFPEGTRGSRGKAMGEFKSGLDYLARQRPEVDLVPVYLHNLDRIMPKGEFLPVPQLSCITFGAPLHHQPGEKKEAFLARSRAAVADLATA